MSSRRPWSGNGTTGGAVLSIDVRSHGTNRVPAGSLAIRHSGAAGTLSLSWDQGTTYTTTLVAGQSFSTGSCVIDSFKIHGAGAAITFEWVATDKEED